MSNVKLFVAELKEYPHVTNKQKSFTKDKAEKEMVAIHKHLNKTARKQAYGADYNKYLNVPEKSLGEPVRLSF